MRKTIVLLAMLVAGITNALALTDQQVVSRAATLYKQGMDEMSIAKQLLMDGATVEQLTTLKEQLEKAGQTTETATGASTAEKSNLRTDNGEQRVPQDLLMLKPEVKKGKEVFGRNIWRQEENSFKPQMNQATPQNYMLGAGDEVVVDIYGNSQVQYREVISPDGYITIENYGPVKLGGMNIMDATRRLKSTVGSRFRGSQLMVSLGQSRTISVQVMGEVMLPGSYQMSAFADVFCALYLAGGVSETGTLRAIKVYRGGAQVATVDLYEYMLAGSTSTNVRLEDGDVIVVGTYEELVFVGGKVKRPMYYEMKKTESLATLMQYAGGFSGEAYTDAVRIFRRNHGAQSVHSIRNDQMDQFLLADGDSVQVEAILNRMKNTVSINGAIFRYGYYGLDENMHTIRQLVDIAGGTREDAVIGRAVLYRIKLDRTYQAVVVDLAGILEGRIADVELREEDQLYIPSKSNQLNNRIVNISGEVYKPGEYRYSENECVEDLILRAGGLTDQASTSKVDIARRVLDPSATEETQIRTEWFSVAIHNELDLNEKGFILEPFDEVYVRRSPAFGTPMNVTIRGEVLFEGDYAMRTQDDRLSDLVHSAGGLSSHAYAKGARLLRKMTDEEMIRRDQLMQMNKAASDKDSVDINKLDLGETYWVGIDLVAAMKNPGCDEDITLREGDLLIVPTINKTVKINGEVLYPNTVSYIKGRRASFYINQAGGYSNNARRTKAYVIYPNGKVAPACCSKIQPGCEIVVPSKPDKKANNAAQSVAIASSAASMASVIATVTTVIVNATKKQ